MAIHKFGGDWTQKKLDIVKDYLTEYTRIFEHNENARYFRRWYVDAFAGTGTRIDSATDNDSKEYLKGSARMSLDVEPSFHSFLFIEQDANKAKELENLKLEYPKKADSIIIVQGDANEVLKDWISKMDWNKERAVVFLDPYGMQVDWETIRLIAFTKGIDLWLLFPFSLLNRLLTNDGIPPQDWCDKLTRIFGTDEWIEQFYTKVEDDTLFGIEESIIKSVHMSYLKEFIVKRLQTVFFAVAPNPLELVNSRNSPLYLLCFAAGNEKGSKPAIKIASHLLKKI